MRKVYALILGYGVEERGLSGIFTTREKAEEVAKRFPLSVGGYYWAIEEWALVDEASEAFEHTDDFDA